LRGVKYSSGKKQKKTLMTASGQIFQPSRKNKNWQQRSETHTFRLNLSEKLSACHIYPFFAKKKLFLAKYDFCPQNIRCAAGTIFKLPKTVQTGAGLRFKKMKSDVCKVR
jgi:hypothetical protein